MRKTIIYCLLLAFALQVSRAKAQTATLGNVTYNSQTVPKFCLTSSNNFVQVHQQFTLSGVVGHVTIEYVNVNGLTGSQQFYSDGTANLFIANVNFNGSGSGDPDKVAGEYTYTIKDQNDNFISTLGADVNVGDGVLQDVVITIPTNLCNGAVTTSITPQSLYPNLIYNVDWYNNGILVSNGQTITSFLPFTNAVITDVGGCVDNQILTGNPTTPTIPVLNVPPSNTVEVNTIVSPTIICGGLQYQLQRKNNNGQWYNMAGTTQKGTYRMKAINAVNAFAYSSNFYVVPKRPHCGLRTAKIYDAVDNPPNCTYTLVDMSGRTVAKVKESSYDAMLQNAKPNAYLLVVYGPNEEVVYFKKIVLPK